jgi:pimeloyl-ACP methyl ester carboxylesterase
MRHNGTVPRLTAPDTTTIHYTDEGRGPAVVLLHGISADGEMNWEWTGIAPALRAAGLRTIAIDQRGHGRSGKPHDPERYRDHHFAADVTAVLDHASLDRCVLAGYSMGGYMALRVAPDEPRVHALVVGGIGDTSPTAWDRHAVAEALEADELNDAHVGEARAIRQYADATGADRHALAAIQRGRVDAPFDLARITVPTLVIVGADDELAGDAEKLASALPDASFLRVPGDHASVLIEPRFVEALVRFASRVSEP